MYFSPFGVDWTGQVDDLSRAHTNGSASSATAAASCFASFCFASFFLSAAVAAVLKAPLATGLLSKPARPDAIGSQRGL